MKQVPFSIAGWIVVAVVVPIAIIVAGLLIVVSTDRAALAFDGASYWWVGALIPVVGALMVLGAVGQRRALMRFAGSELIPLLCAGMRPGRKLLRCGLMVCALVFLAAAILGPRWGMYLDKQKIRGVDIVVALDVSRSMLAKDVAPNRIERAKLELKQQLTERGVFRGANRLGLIAFAGATSLRLPLTTDHAAFRNKLDQLAVGSVPRGGTAVAKALDAASDLFAISPADATKIILLVTDGEDHEGAPVETARALFQEQGIRVYTVAAGDPASAVGAQVPMNEKPGAPPLLFENQIVFSKVSDEALKAIASATEGEYVPLESFSRMVARMAALEGKELGTEERMRHRPQYQWFATICLVLLLVESVVRETSSRADDDSARTWQQMAA